MPRLERRSATRVNLLAEAYLSMNGESWKGTLHNASLGGLYMVFAKSLPVSPNQPIQLGLVSDAGVLEIQGLVVTLREVAALEGGETGHLSLGLGIQFTSIGEMERQILQSLLDALPEGGLAFQVNGLLIPQETGDLLLEVQADKTAAVEPLQPSPGEAEESAPPDRRLTARGRLAMPVGILEKLADPPARELTAESLDLSLGGMSLRVKARAEAFAQPLCLRFSLPALQREAAPGQAAAEEAMACTTAAEVVWTAPDPSREELRLGLRFPYLNDETKLRITALVAQIMSAGDETDTTEERLLASETLDGRNAEGQRLAIYHDARREGLPPGAPVVIVSPGYGETKKEHIALAYHLAANGLHVLRYDHSNHVGESDGDIRHSTLSRMLDDLLAMVDLAAGRWPDSPLAVITTSLAGRVALKAVGRERRIRLLILLTGVVDVQATLLAVHQEDLVGDHMRGIRRGMINMLGFNIEADTWLADAVAGGYADLRATVRDAEQARTPVAFFCAEQDAWVGLDSVKAVHAALPSERKQLFVIPEALHRLNENPRKARAVFRQVVACCLEHFGQAAAPPLRQPSQREIGLQSRLERERARAQNQMARIDNVNFWRDYLEHFHYIANVSDFWQLLDHVYRLVGPLTAADRILDAGCGNGNFGVFLMVNRAYSHRHGAPDASLAFGYVGTDFVFDALRQARRNLSQVAAESGPAPAGAIALPDAGTLTSFTLSDLNLPLPFADDRFTCVVSNLVIGYLQDPLATLRELLRVLTPGGKLVISNLKPQADLSQIYRNFAQRTDRPEEMDEARQLLNNSGKIKLGESDGIFRFFNRQELATLLGCSGAQQPRIYSTFGNQAFIAVATKPAAAPLGQPSDRRRHLEPVYQA